MLLRRRFADLARRMRLAGTRRKARRDPWGWQQGLRGGRRAEALTFPVRNAAFFKIVGREFHRDAIAGDDADKIFAHLACHMGEHLMPILQLHAKPRVGQGLGNDTGNFQRGFFRHTTLPPAPQAHRLSDRLRRAHPTTFGDRVQGHTPKGRLWRFLGTNRTEMSVRAPRRSAAKRTAPPRSDGKPQDDRRVRELDSACPVLRYSGGLQGLPAPASPPYRPVARSVGGRTPARSASEGPAMSCTRSRVGLVKRRVPRSAWTRRDRLGARAASFRRDVGPWTLPSPRRLAYVGGREASELPRSVAIPNPVNELPPPCPSQRNCNLR